MTDSGFSRQTLPQLITQIRSDLYSRFQQDDVLRRADAEVYGRAQAAAVHTLYGYIDYLARNLLPDLSDESWLTRHANMKRCPRKDAVAAVGFIRWDGVADGLTVPTGTIVQREDFVEFITTQDMISSAGVLRIPVQCSTTGIIGNTDDQITMLLASPISGLSSSAQADSIAGGNDIEPLEEWRSRVIERWYYIPQGGSDPDYIVWAKEVPGVTRAWMWRHWAGTGTVGVMVANSDPVNPIPDDAVVQATKDHISPLAPVAGSSLFVFPPEPKQIDFHIRLTPDTEAIRFAVIAELRSMFMRDGTPGGVLAISRISEAISVATGEYKHELLSPTADIKLGISELPIVGEVSWD